MSGAIAIVGMAVRLPEATNLASYAQLLFTGRDAITTLTDAELAAEGLPAALAGDPAYVRAAALLTGIDFFAAERFGIPPHEVELMDPQQRILLEVAADALVDAGYQPRQLERTVSTFVGTALSTYLLTRLAPHLLTGPSSAGQLQAMVGNDKDYAAAQLAYRLGIEGPVVTVQTACSTSLVAVHLACQSLLGGECDLALAGGVAVRVPHRVGYRHEAEGMLSATGRCRSYGAEADGTVFGSGCGVVLLERLEDARSRGAPIWAVIRGSAVNNDGARKIGFTAPSQDRQAAVIAEALAVAGVAPGEIGYVEGHGTGTPLGDPIEVAALAAVFRGLPTATVGLGSVKSNIGHTETAAGIAGLVKAALMLAAGRLAPTLHAAHANPHIDFASTPFRLVQEAEPWPSRRLAGVSSFGIGGSNAHVVLEAAATEARQPARPAAPAAPGRGYWFQPARSPGRLFGPGTATGFGTVLHETELSTAAFDWLADHRVDGRCVLPAVAYLAALHELAPGPIDELAVEDMVELPGGTGDPPWLRAIVEPGRRIRFYAGARDAWRPAATAALGGAPSCPAELGEPPMPPVADEADAPAWYDRLRRNGLDFGPAFQVVECIAAADGAARLRLRGGLPLVAVLDGGLQAVAAAFGGEGRFLPMAFEALQLSPDIIAARTVLARLRPGAGEAADTIVATVWWQDALGRCVGQVGGIACRGRPGVGHVDYLHELAWRPDLAPSITTVHDRLEAVAAGYAAAALADPTLVVTPAQARLAARLRQHAAQPSRAVDPAGLAAELAAAHPGHAPEIELVRRAGQALPAILGGRLDPLALLFEQDRPTGAYAQSPLAAAANAVAAALAAGQRPRRVIEIGGGTGGTTGPMLERLGPGVDYLFTDLGAAFLSAAAARFGSFPLLRTRRLDIAVDPAGQGVSAGGFDLVVAANVLHATPDLRTAIRHTVGLLAPGGRLVLVEGTEASARLDLVFGTTAGWWSFADHDLRTEGPLLPAKRWLELLAEAGLVDAAMAFAGGGQAVLTASRTPAAGWLAIGRDDRLAKAIGLPFMHLDALSLDRGLAGVVALAGLEHDEPQAALLDLLTVARTLADASEAPRLLVPTRAGETLASDHAPQTLGAALGGFVRTLVLEHPALAARTVDLDRDDDPAAVITVERALADGEDRVAWRHGQRWRARLAPLPAAAAPATWRLTPALTQAPVSRPAPGPGQVLVRVRAAGLNFKDVLIAGGLVPGDRLGGECAGEVAALGAGVQHLHLGQAVIAVGGGALAHWLVADAALVVAKPATLDFATAAALPVAGVTAWLALRHRVRLQPGARVLVQNAAGGVGQIALRLVQAAGAVAVATAGSPARRAWLAAAGVAEIHDSRAPLPPAVAAVDVVLGAATGDVRRSHLAALRPGGRYIDLGRTDLLDPGVAASLRPDVDYEIIALDQVDAATFGPLLRELVAAVAADPLLRPPVTSLPMAQATTALGRLRRGEVLGKLVLRPSWPLQVRGDGSYLVTGGRGGLGPSIVAWLEAKGAGAVLTLGRQASADPWAIVGDVAEPEALAAVTRRIAELGLPPLRGIIHAAGVLADRPITALTALDLAAPWRPKLAGAASLAAAFPDLELEIAFSSAGGVLGSPGQANHTSAAAALDAFAATRHAAGHPAVSLDWPAWAMAGAAVMRGADARIARLGLPAISLEQAHIALDRALAGDVAHIVVLPIDWSRFADTAEAAAPIFAERMAARARPRMAGASQPGVAAALQPSPSGRITSLDGLRAAAAPICLALLPPGVRLDPRLALTDQGLDSLGALELRNRLGRLVDARLPATLLFDQPSFDALVAYLATEHLGLAVSPAPGGPPQSVEEAAVLADDVDARTLSDAELDAALALFEERLAEAVS